MTGGLLVVDDEPEFLRTLATALRGAGYAVDTADTAESAIEATERLKPDAVVLDLVLPDGSGVDVCTAVRRWTNTPIIVVSAVGEETEKVAALDAGADDYVTKPFDLGELLARLRAVLRRAAPTSEPVMRVGPLEIDRDARAVRRDGQLVHLTPHEFDLLRVLAEHEGKLLTHNRLLREVWGPAYQRESNYLHVYVSQLRRKIEADPSRPVLLLTAAGAGYRLVAPESRTVLRAADLRSLHGSASSVPPAPSSPRARRGETISRRRVAAHATRFSAARLADERAAHPNTDATSPPRSSRSSGHRRLDSYRAPLRSTESPPAMKHHYF